MDLADLIMFSANKSVKIELPAAFPSENVTDNLLPAETVTVAIEVDQSEVFAA